MSRPTRSIKPPSVSMIDQSQGPIQWFNANDRGSDTSSNDDMPTLVAHANIGNSDENSDDDSDSDGVPDLVTRRYSSSSSDNDDYDDDNINDSDIDENGNQVRVNCISNYQIGETKIDNDDSDSDSSVPPLKPRYHSDDSEDSDNRSRYNLSSRITPQQNSKKKTRGKKKQNNNKSVDEFGPKFESEETIRMNKMYASQTCFSIYTKLGIKPHFDPRTDYGAEDLFILNHTLPHLIRQFFEHDEDMGGADAPWLYLDQNCSSPIYSAAIEHREYDEECAHVFQDLCDELLILASEKKRKDDVLEILKLGLVINSLTVIDIFKPLPRDRGDQFNNMLAKTLLSKCNISINRKEDINLIMTEVSDRVGKQRRKLILNFLKKASQAKKAKPRKSNSQQTKLSSTEETNKKKGSATQPKRKQKVVKDTFKSQFEGRILKALKFYQSLLEDYNNKKFVLKDESRNEEQKLEYQVCSEKKSTRNTAKFLSSSQVANAMARCSKMPEEKQELMVKDVEMNMDLADFNLESEWTIEMTEEAHKWFRKHRKRQNDFCERVIRRLKILGTGRWPYVLCKPLKTKNSSARLYESKIDSGSRIIWEVATSFSPRRSSPGNPFWEQVIRVWDIVDDHDKLSDRISLAIDRIEQSLLRGEQSTMYSNLDGAESSNETLRTTSGSTVFPRVFSTKNGSKCEEVKDKSLCEGQSRHYPPASHDPLRYTLLKFYQLNNDAVKMLLEANDEKIDLPFTPGPKEHEIIHHSSNPNRSILLMGRSGTGKTTCLVFRMWAQHMAYVENSMGKKPRQLFVTKNAILRNEVEKSFGTMGLAFRKRSDFQNSININCDDNVSSKNSQEKDESESEIESKFPLFLTANEWLDILDKELPGKSFFTRKEVEERSLSRNSMDDVVERRIQAIIASRNEEQKVEIVRQEMTYKSFRKCWPKINARHKTDLDQAMVWREIYTFIKGSVDALKLNDPDRELITHRYLNLEEYLALPRKQSRLNQDQRQTVYELYEIYEKVKKEGNYYDSMDIVYNLAGRVTDFLSMGVTNTDQRMLPIDTLFVDEVQDFTMTELYLLTKLSRDPNNIMLAGDTAQSITEGVAFRFTDVRQIFFELFGGIEPDLLQLTHNYRSHSGILRLAACVVELLYFFFSDSLDRLPPDLGLFDGPKPMTMEISTEELAIMLHGSQREASRIEFGAHQVVIVRNEIVKKSLADEFGIDKDWILTVQESKGLEFDDVLLYNFFTESEAGDLWRIVSNYTEEDVTEYYSGISDELSEVQSFQWDKMIKTVRHLEFNHEQHKVLETELKILYTAITRARVNIFIAERDSNLCSPMFNYFKQRQVVNEVSKQTSEGISSIPVFGKMSTVEDWRKRGESYLRVAAGDNKIGYLRLAAKCFGKAGEEKRQKNALAYLAYEEGIDRNINSKPDLRKSVQQREQLYGIATQLLEAEDIEFLDKAGACLLESGEIEKERCARIFELYARLSYVKRAKVESIMPDAVEQRNFHYAAQLYEDLSKEAVSIASEGQKLVNAIRNYLCSGSIQGFRKVSVIIDSNLEVLKHHAAKDVHQLFIPSNSPAQDPLSYLQQQMLVPSKYQFLRESLAKLSQ